MVHGDSRGVPAKSMVALCLVRICLRLALAVTGHTENESITLILVSWKGHFLESH